MKRIVSIVALSIVALSFVDGPAAFGRMIANTAAEPPPSPPPPPAPAAPSYSWSGLYIGGNLGAGFSAGTFSDVFGSTFATTTINTTFVGGGQAGVNYEFPSGIVIGAEAMFDWTPNQSNNIGAALGGAIATAGVNNRWVTTATGRLGHAWDRILVYVKGGGAWVGTSNSALTVSTGAPLALSSSTTDWGWTAGIGLECAVWGNWSGRVEYDYVGLKRQSFTVGSGTAPFATDVIATKSLNLNLITAGVNYRFGLW